jgi:hypothetical protein
VPISRFDDTLTFKVDEDPELCEYIAMGPVGATDTVKELCAWVYQRNGENDAAATEMTTTETGKGKLIAVPGSGRWQLPLGKISDCDFQSGAAFAVAVALMVDANRKERVVWWGQPIDLTVVPAATYQASMAPAETLHATT